VPALLVTASAERVRDGDAGRTVAVPGPPRDAGAALAEYDDVDIVALTKLVVISIIITIGGIAIKKSKVK